MTSILGMSALFSPTIMSPDRATLLPANPRFDENPMKNKGTGGLVYSTEHGRMCPVCRQPVDRCTCSSAETAPPSDGVVRIRRETKGRNGKGVTVVTGVPLEPAALASFAKQLRQACSSGGTLKDGVIEIQGDHVELVSKALEARGWRVKRSGG
ncbi:translation initiation factor Sui1 [Pseudogulbenkiania ferrooxidans]|nr:translation initiation factor Sui1 [Pseudogulbenkiania ferrooxidans]